MKLSPFNSFQLGKDVWVLDKVGIRWDDHERDLRWYLYSLHEDPILACIQKAIYKGSFPPSFVIGYDWTRFVEVFFVVLQTPSKEVFKQQFTSASLPLLYFPAAFEMRGDDKIDRLDMECFFFVFFTQEGTPHILRFDFWYTVIIPAAPQETVEEAGIEPGTAALQSSSPSRALANWATTSPCGMWS
jgi:hypothetical protein